MDQNLGNPQFLRFIKEELTFGMKEVTLLSRPYEKYVTIETACQVLTSETLWADMTVTNRAFFRVRCFQPRGSLDVGATFCVPEFITFVRQAKATDFP